MQTSLIKQNLFLMDGTLTDATVILLDRHVANMKSGQDLVVRIKSGGGRLSLVNTVFELFHFAQEHKQSRIITQAEYTKSASLLIFLNGQVRQVTRFSKATIHLPVHVRGEYCQFAHDEAVKTYAEYVSKKTSLTPDACKALNEATLDYEEMLEYCIATEQVPSFKPYV